MINRFGAPLPHHKSRFSRSGGEGQTKPGSRWILGFHIEASHLPMWRRWRNMCSMVASPRNIAVCDSAQQFAAPSCWPPNAHHTHTHKRHYRVCVYMCAHLLGLLYGGLRFLTKQRSKAIPRVDGRLSPPTETHKAHPWPELCPQPVTFRQVRMFGPYNFIRKAIARLDPPPPLPKQ